MPIAPIAFIDVKKTSFWKTCSSGISLVLL